MVVISLNYAQVLFAMTLIDRYIVYRLYNEMQFQKQLKYRIVGYSL